MAKAEWGIKRTCRDCGARFYDLQRDPVPCPQCGAELALKAAPKAPKEAPQPKIEVEEVAADRKAPPVANDDAVEDSDDDADDVTSDGDAVDDEDDDDDDDLIEDASDLGEDDDDMAEAREHIDE